MRKSAFTMIELIFVIVILGILASVAILKLAATRADAQITKGRADIQTTTKEIQGVALAHGNVSMDLANDENGSKTIHLYEESHKAIVGNDDANISFGGSDCIEFKIRRGVGNDINLSVDKLNNSDVICQGVQAELFKGNINEINYSLREKSITY